MYEQLILQKTTTNKTTNEWINKKNEKIYPYLVDMQLSLLQLFKDHNQDNKISC